MATESTGKKKPTPRKRSANADLQALVAQLTSRIDSLESQLIDATREKPVDRPDVPLVDPLPSAEFPLTDDDVKDSLRGDEPIDLVEATPAPFKTEDGEMPLSDKDIAELFAQADQLVAPKPNLTAADLQNLLDDNPESAAFTPPSATMMSDAEIAKLMQAAADEQSKGFGSETPSRPAPTDSKPEKPKPAARPQLTLVSRDTPAEGSLDQVVPLELAVAALARPIALEPGKLVCEVAEPFDHEALADISRATGRLIETIPTPTDTVVAGLRDLYGPEASARCQLALVQAGAAPSWREWLLMMIKRVAS